MSRTKNLEKTETENAVSENLVEQTELDGLSASSGTENAVETVKESVATKTVNKTVINKVATVSSVKGNKRMGVNKFLLYYPQDIYVEALLRHNYPRSVFTVDEWFLRIEELLNKPIYN